MKTVCLSNLETIRQCQNDWDSVAGDHPFCNWNWMSSWYKAFGFDADIRIAVFIENGTWHGLLPMVIQQGQLGRCLRFASSGRACADYVGPLVRPGSEDVVIPMMFDWLRSELNAPENNLDYAEFDGVRIGDQNTRTLTGLFETANQKVYWQQLEGCWVVPIDSDWDTFVVSIKKSFRRKIRKADRHLKLEDLSVFHSQSEKDVQELWPDFVRLHQLRRAELAQQGCFGDPRFEDFLKLAINKMVPDQQASFIGVRYQRQTIASMLLLHGGQQSYMYQTGIDPQFKNMEPGHLLGSLAVQRAMSLGHIHFDFLRGDEPYKANWNTQRVSLENIKIVSRRLPSQIRHRIWETGRTIKNWLPATWLPTSQA